ncbi:MAG: winged helix-turn-helix domain-containing protein [Methylococcales bacterium]|nr:winged helix-turn-helix domain-containing protein [Methylococcales bacterium]
MKKLNNIAVFCEEKSILAMLKGYCYAKDINVTIFNRNNFETYEALKQHPDIIITQLDWINANNSSHASILRDVATREHIKICALNTNSNQIFSSELPVWIDEIINNPFDIAEINGYFQRTLFLNTRLSKHSRKIERRPFTESKRALFSNTSLSKRIWNMKRRSFTKSKRIEFKNGIDDGYKISINQDSQHKGEEPELTYLRIDKNNKCLFLNGIKVSLTPKEFELMEFLSSDINRVFMISEIINHLWPESVRATKSDLYQYMHLLRKKLEKDPNNPQIIKTVRGFGYKLNFVCSD